MWKYVYDNQASTNKGCGEIIEISPVLIRGLEMVIVEISIYFAISWQQWRTWDPLIYMESIRLLNIYLKIFKYMYLNSSSKYMRWLLGGPL